MDNETLTFEQNEFPSFLVKSIYCSGKADALPSMEADFQDFEIKEVDRIQKESLIEILRKEDKDQFINRSERLFEESSNQEDFKEKESNDPKPNQHMERSFAGKLFKLACKFDSVECAKALIEGETGRTASHSAAEMLATRCIELLLRKQAPTDFRSSDRKSQIDLSMALSSKMMKVLWTPEESLEDLLVLLSETDLTVVRKLVEKSKEVAEVAYFSAMEGRVVSLAALLMVAQEIVTGLIMVKRPDVASAFKETTTIYECVIREALSLGQKEISLRGTRTLGFSSNKEKRKALLCEIELLQLFGAKVLQGGTTDRRVFPPLIRASQAGDEAVITILLKANIDVTEVDGEGNSALHWYLRTSSNEKKPRIVWLLLKHGAIVSQKNRLGLTPLHVAAANGNLQALQILLLQDSDSINAVSEMKESPLFFAVKNDFINCAQLLLRYGANTQLLNLRKQRPIDFAKSQEMRFLLNQTNILWKSRGIQIEESATYWLKDEQYVSDEGGGMLEAFLNVKEEEPISAERLGPVAKTEICRYFESPGGCVRGEKCFYAHGEGELLGMSKQGEQMVRCSATDELRKKIFIGGLPPSVDSETLGEFFEEQFGPIEDAVVIGSQAGDQVYSRGFGFVTFKNEESVGAAVQAHYVTILGKQVEIKGAVPKPLLLPAEIPKPIPRQKQLHQELNPNNEKNTGNGFHAYDTSSNQILPSWVTTFKKWLPGFLYEVSKRLKEGEWYPLSSLKGDFRATCGLELDHASIGYLKLSDFMRSFPGICRMKVVPVGGGGRGPATHMVLLPNPHHQYFLRIPEHHVDSSSNRSPLILDENINNSDEDFKLFLDSLSSAAYHYNFGGYIGFGEGGSSSSSNSANPSQNKGKEIDTSGGGGGGGGGGDKRLLTPQNPWWRLDTSKAAGRGQGDEEKDKSGKPEASDKPQKPFSFFARQYDYSAESYKKFVASQWKMEESDFPPWDPKAASQKPKKKRGGGPSISPSKKS